MKTYTHNLDYLRYVLVFVIGVATFQYAQDDTMSRFSFRSSTTYDNHLVGNLSGGQKTGSVSLGLLQWGLQGVLKGTNGNEVGVFNLTLANAHGGQPTETLIGDYQAVSNIEAGNQTFLFELWYAHNFGDLVVTAGLQDMNAQFAVSEYAGLFVNSSFGIHSNVASNIPNPIYPLTSLGLTANWQVSDFDAIKIGFFDGLPDDFEENPYNINWRIGADQGVLAITEYERKNLFSETLPGTIKIGTYFSHSPENAKRNPGVDKNNYGLYAVIDQQLFSHENNAGGLGFFGQFGYSPKERNSNHMYVGGGLHYTGLISGREDDVAGLAFANASFHGLSYDHELVIEMNYQFMVTENIMLKPDLQYVIQPSGTDQKLDNALVALLHIGFGF